jgi:hypothetical protein
MGAASRCGASSTAKGDSHDAREELGEEALKALESRAAPCGGRRGGPRRSGYEHSLLAAGPAYLAAWAAVQERFRSNRRTLGHEPNLPTASGSNGPR